MERDMSRDSLEDLRSKFIRLSKGMVSVLRELRHRGAIRLVLPDVGMMRQKVKEIEAEGASPKR